jgi:cold shock protein
MSTNVLLGVVRKLKTGYGFIAGHDGSDYFFHWTAMVKGGTDFRQLEVGDRVEFHYITGDKGRRATDVRHLTESKAA